jgi:hypothetical protein
MTEDNAIGASAMISHSAVEQNPDAVMITPLVLEIIAEKN